MLEPLALDSSRVGGGYLGKRLDAIFWAGVLASTLLLVWSTLSTTIGGIDEGVLSMARLFPPTYWAGFALLLAISGIWYLGHETKAYHLLLVALWMGYVFLSPELMQAHPRGVSSYAHALGIGYVLEGREREFFYFPWLGFHYTFAILLELIDVSHVAVMRVGMLALYLALAVALIAFFGRVLPDRRAILVATLTYLAMAAVLGVRLTPPQLALILMLFAFSLLASLDASPMVNRLLLIGLFSAIVITHALSALVVVYVAAVVVLARWRRPTVRHWSTSMVSLSFLSGTILSVWLLYSSDFWFPMAVRAFWDNVLREPIVLISPFSHVSPAWPGRAEISLLTLAFLAVLLVWFVSVVARRAFWKGLSRGRLFPLLVISGLPLLIIATGNFTWEAFVRVFFYSSPFMAWFLAKESVDRGIVASFLVLLLGLGCVLLYARDFKELPTSQQIEGANFVVGVARSSDTVIQGDCLSLGAITNTIHAPSIGCAYPNPAKRELETMPDARGFTFTVLSAFGEESASFTFGFGKPWWESLRNSVQREGLAQIYSNGKYDVFTDSRTR
jgi:hypothetical protein